MDQELKRQMVGGIEFFLGLGIYSRASAPIQKTRKKENLIGGGKLLVQGFSTGLRGAGISVLREQTTVLSQIDHSTLCDPWKVTWSL